MGVPNQMKTATVFLLATADALPYDIPLPCVNARVRQSGAMTVGSEIPIALRAAYLALHRRSETAFARYAVTADQFVLLATLARGHALTQRELARRMSSDPS